VSLVNEQQSHNLMLKVDPLSTIRNKLIKQSEKLKTSVRLRVFVSNISSLLLKLRYIRDMGFCFSYFAFRTERNIFIFFVVHVRWTACVQRKFEAVHLIKKHQNITSFNYYKLRFLCFELNVFSHCFDLKDSNLNKHFECLRKDLFTLQLTWSDEMSQMYVVYTSRSDSRVLRN